MRYSLTWLLLSTLTALTLTLHACGSLDQDIVDIKTYTSQPTAIGDTFNFVYTPADTASFSSGVKPEAVYTLRFWQPQLYEYEKPVVQSVALENYYNKYWLFRFRVPDNAQMISYAVKGAEPADTLPTQSYIVLKKNGEPVKSSYYRVAASMLRSNAPADTVLSLLKAETALYSDAYDAYILYWSLLYKTENRTDEALGKIEEEMYQLRTAKRDDPNLLEAIAMTYIYGIGDRSKAYEATREIPDSYLHPLNLYNRFLIERDYDKRETALSAMTNRYAAHELTPKMYLSLLQSYIADQKNYRERAAIFSESILNRRLASLRQSRVLTYATRYLFSYYAKLDISKALPYANDVLRVDYDREVYDELSILDFAERFAESAEYSGLAIDLATKALQALAQNAPNKKLAVRPEAEFIQTDEARARLNLDLQGRAYYAMGKAYHRVGNDGQAVENLLRAKDLALSRQPDIYYQLALATKNADAEKSLGYALRAAALDPAPERAEWLRQSYKFKLKKGESVESLVDAARQSGAQAVKNLTLQTADGKSVSLESLKDKTVVLYFWSPASGMSRLTMSEMQTIYAKYHARGAEIFAIDAAQDLQSLRTDSKPQSLYADAKDYAYSFPFATAPAALKELNVSYLPSVVVVKNGKVFYRNSGYDLEFGKTVDAEVQSLLAEPKSQSDSPPKKKRRLE